jgi:hypothetical protein
MARNTFSVSKTISDQQLSKIIQIESAGRPTVKAPTSSATGLFQFIDSTWMAMVRKYKPEWLTNRTKRQVLDMRKDPVKSIEMGARFTEENARALGRGWQEGDLYLAHFLGIAGAKKLFRASPSAACEPLVGAAAVRANRSILQGKTCGEVRAWAERKMRTAGTTNWIAKFWPQQPQNFVDSELSAEAHEQEGDTPDEGHTDDPVDELDVEVDDEGIELTEIEIRAAQVALKAMGYHEVGNVDGKFGSRTAAAISAFQFDQGMERNGELDHATKIAIDEGLAEDFKRPIAPERATGKPKDSKIIDGAEKQGGAGIFALITGFFTWLGSSLQDNFPFIREVGEFLAPFKQVVVDNFGLILLAIGGLVVWQASRIYTARVEAHQKGELS